MKKQQEVLQDIEDVKNDTYLYLQQEPQAADLNWLHGELTRLSQLVSNNWPLLEDDKKTIEIGVFGARNLHELDNARLAVKLAKLDAQLKEPVKSFV